MKIFGGFIFVMCARLHPCRRVSLRRDCVRKQTNPNKRRNSQAISEWSPSTENTSLSANLNKTVQINKHLQIHGFRVQNKGTEWMCSVEPSTHTPNDNGSGSTFKTVHTFMYIAWRLVIYFLNEIKVLHALRRIVFRRQRIKQFFFSVSSPVCAI